MKTLITKSTDEGKWSVKSNGWQAMGEMEVKLELT